MLTIHFYWLIGLIDKYPPDGENYKSNKLIISLGCGSANKNGEIKWNHFLNYMLSNNFSANVFKSNTMDSFINFKNIDVFRFQFHFSAITEWLIKIKKCKNNIDKETYNNLKNIFQERHIETMIHKQPSMELDDISIENIQLLFSYTIAFISMIDYYEKIGHKNYLNIASDVLAHKIINSTEKIKVRSNIKVELDGSILHSAHLYFKYFPQKQNVYNNTSHLETETQENFFIFG